MDKQMLVDIAALNAYLAVIEYAIWHIEGRFTSGDTKNLNTAAKQCRAIINKWLGEISNETAEMDKQTSY